MKDAVGQPLRVGDEVAYVSRSGSRLSIERRVVEQVMEHDLLLNSDPGRARFINPKNVVRIARAEFIDSQRSA